MARAKEVCYLFMRDMAGDRPHFEEAVRALFANDAFKLRELTAHWPAHIQEGIGATMDFQWPTRVTEEHL